MMAEEENNNTKKELKTISSIPKHLAFNKFIVHGYRCNYTFKECVKSLFFLHNETVNIYTHGIMTAYLIATLRMPKLTALWQSKHEAMLLIHWVASLLPFAASTTYHLFMCHIKGSTLYGRLLSLDMIGIWAVNTFGYIIAIFTTFHCNSRLQIFSVILYISLSFAALYFLVKARTPYQRFLPLCYYLLIRPMIIISRLLFNRYSRHEKSLGTGLYVSMDAAALIGAVINVLKFPERFLPGQLDFALNSHQIMHIFTIASMCLLGKAAEDDLQFLAHCKC